MKILRLFLIMFVFFSFVHFSTQYVFAQEKSRSIEKGLEQRIALDLRDVDVIDALKFLATKADINIIVGKNVAGRVSLFLKDVTTEDAFNIILKANNLAYEKRGNLLYVMTDKEYKEIHGDDFHDMRELKIINLQFAKPDSVFKAIDILKSDVGNVLVDEETGAVILMDTPDKIKDMESAIENLDRVMETRTFDLKYAQVADVEAVLAKRLDAKKTGSVSADYRNDAVIVTAFPERMKEIERLIAGMDQKTRQVLIEAKILNVILNDNFSMGVDWNKVFEETKMKGLNFTGSYTLTPTPTEFFRIGVGDDMDSGHGYSGVMQILQEYGKIDNLSSPSIAVVNGEEASILVGTTQAYVTTTVATGGTTSTTAAQVTFLDVGVQLKLTPYINSEGYVKMKIRPEISSVDGTISYQIAPSVNNEVPLVAKTTADTTIMVKDGRTIMIGGLKKDNNNLNERKLPVLGDIPFLGSAFKRTVQTTEKSEIVVFITPRIISGDEDIWNTATTDMAPRETRGYEEELVPRNTINIDGGLIPKGKRSYEVGFDSRGSKEEEYDFAIDRLGEYE